MQTTPKSLRLQIAFFGRTNVGKSSIVNLIAGQDVSLVSDIPGTTTDVVEKSIELLPLGPVTMLDTAGIDDISELAKGRISRTNKVLDRVEVSLIVVEPNLWTDYEENLINETKNRRIPNVIIINKTDLTEPTEDFIKLMLSKANYVIAMSSVDVSKRDAFISELKSAIIAVAPDEYNNPPALLGDIIDTGRLIVMIVPIDREAPKGRIILPQVQAIRDVLDNHASVIVTQVEEYPNLLKILNKLPDLVICDSQVVHKMMEYTPLEVKTTTFSILFSRFKGDLIEEVKGASVVGKLKQRDKVLIAEACSHHAIEDDIGRVKLPNWLKKFVQGDIEIDYAQGRDFPANLTDYKLVIHCGSCMLTRNEKLVRIQKCKNQGVPITNYGLTISFVQGVLERALSPFPDALAAYRESI